jgi:alcohol dehydrogenase class IV
VVDTLYENVTHGDAYALTTGWGLRFNLEHATAGLARLARGIGIGDGLSDMDAAKRVPDFVDEFYRRLELPVRLRDASIPRGDIGRIAQDAMGDFYLHQTARTVKDAAEIEELRCSVCGEPRLGSSSALKPAKAVE